METPQRILVIRGGALGDFVVTLPVFAALRQKFPNAYLASLCSPAHGTLVEETGIVDEWRDLNGRAWVGLFEDGEIAREDCSSWLAGFDCVVSFLHDPCGVFHGHVERITGVPVLTGCHRPEAGAGKPAAVILLEALNPLGLADADRVSRMRLPSKIIDPGRLALHPGSGSEAKNWPAGRWKELIGHLVAGGEALLLIGGECEAERVADLGREFAVHSIINEPLPQVARALAGCRGLVGHDSGITHLAAALGVPCVCLWGETDEMVWRPAGDFVTLLRGKDGVNSIEAATVLCAIKKCTRSIDS